MRRSGTSRSARRRPRGLLAVFAFLCILPLCVLPIGGLPAQAADLDYDVYLRDVKGVGRAVDILEAEARRREATEIVIAFDQISFDPPQSDNEFTDTHYFGGDLAKWLNPIEAWSSRTDAEIYVVATLGPGRIRVGQPAWRHSIHSALDYRWFEDDDFDDFEPALEWIERWAPKKGGMLVLIGGEMTPERWVDWGTYGSRQAWRFDLARVGRYWDEEAIGKALERRGCPFYAVAPEVCFGDEVPEPSLPACPWASRPRRPGAELLDWASVRKRLPSLKSRREQLDEALKPLIPDDEERARVVDGMLEGEKGPGAPGGQAPGGQVPGPRPPVGPTPGAPPAPPVDLPIVGGRFDATTPLWFPSHGGLRLLNDHTPSAFGHWPYARVAARTGGRYLCYPFPPAPWLDVCPRDSGQLRRLAPELVKRSKFVKLRLGDPAVSAVCRAEALVVKDTPWTDGGRHGTAQGWDAFESVRPHKRTRGFRLRRKPYDMFLMGRMHALAREGERLADVVRQYDDAIEILDRALERVRKGTLKSAQPRAIADLRLSRFWFSMSAFHLDALGIYLREIERFAPPDFDEARDEFVVTYLPCIRMSDVLDAYDGRTLSSEDEKQYRRALAQAHDQIGLGVWPVGREVPGQQGNVLLIAESDPNYRAKRTLSNVLRYLDRRLMPRALDMIQAARQVMAHHAKTPWGWTTYYSEAKSFIFLPGPGNRGRTPRRGTEGEAEPPPWSPTPGGRGGSTPGGPTTPR